MEYIISQLTISQVSTFYPLFYEILNSEFPGYTPTVLNYLLNKIYTQTNFYYWVEQNQKTILVASCNNEFVGFAVIDNPYGGVSLLRWLGVAKEHQRKGIGKKFITTWQEIATKQGAHKIEVAAQPEAKEFYAKVGLTLEGKRARSYFGINQYIYGKVIGDPNDRVMTAY